MKLTSHHDPFQTVMLVFQLFYFMLAHLRWLRVSYPNQTKENLKLGIKVVNNVPKLQV